jgi:hypothetical protein
MMVASTAQAAELASGTRSSRDQGQSCQPLTAGSVAGGGGGTSLWTGRRGSSQRRIWNPGRERGAQEVARGVPIAGDQAGFVVRAERVRDGAADDDLVMGVGDGQVPAGAQHAGELGHHRCERRHMGQREAGYDELHRVVGERELVQVAEYEPGRGHAGVRSAEHLG